MWPAGFQGDLELDEMKKRSCSACTCSSQEEEKKHKLCLPDNPAESDDVIVRRRQCSSDVSQGMILPPEPTKTGNVLVEPLQQPPPPNPPDRMRAAGREGEGEKEGMKSETGSSGGGENCGREKLQRHRSDVAGRVWIPDLWGQEELLKDWIDCAAFDSSLVPSGIMSAKEALVEECRRANIWWATG
ncbi:hypothetical protein ACLOJK_005819 [Asimina triloba]